MFYPIIHTSIEVLKMQKIKNEFNETSYTFETQSGLKTSIIHKKGFKRSLAALGTPFGSIHLNQKVDGKSIQHKKGLAHFLEHKLFDDEGQDILAKFAEYGASANAFTSFDQTVYYFSTNLDIEEPLKLLMTFVNRFDITEASVEKEKGIIVEELKMYDKMPEMALLMNTYQNVYHNFPMKYDIGGTIDSVNSTTLKDLQEAYALNYNPHKMQCVVITGEEPQKIQEIINSITVNRPIYDVKDVFEEEPLSVVKEENILPFNVKTDKMSYSFKFKYDGKNILFDEFVIRMILALNFTEFNENYQSWLDQEIINDFFSYDVDLREGFGVIYFFNEGEHPEAFKELINHQMNHLKVDEICYNQIKKRYYGQTILSLSQYDHYALNMLSAFFKGTSYYEYLSDIKNVKIEAVLKMLGALNNFSTSFNLMTAKK